MKNLKYIQKISQEQIQSIHSELMIRRDKLIKLAHDQHVQMDTTDRKNIISFFEHSEKPKHPKSIPELMKIFFTSCFSYAPLRKYLSSISESIPTPNSLPKFWLKSFLKKVFL